MPEKNISQVRLYKLIFTMNWEDPESDYQALKIKPGETIMTITSGACNTLGFLLKDPGRIFTVDINPSQSFLLELKMAAIQCMDYEEFIEFTGLKKSGKRLDTYRIIREKLSEPAKEFWDYNYRIIQNGFLMKGRYDKFIRLVAKVIHLVEGGRKVDDLFRERSLDEQREVFYRRWDTPKSRLVFNLFFNKYVLARRGLKADYFHFDDGSNSFAESFYKRFSKVVRDVPVKGNYFLHLYFNGRYRSDQEVPEYLQKENYATIKSRLDRISIVTNDAKKWLLQVSDNFIDCFALSNICELMDLDDTLFLFNEVYRTAKPGARICFRNLVLPREVPEVLQDRIVKDELLTRDIFNRDRSFVYGKVAAYNILK